MEDLGVMGLWDYCGFRGGGLRVVGDLGVVRVYS